MKNLLLFLFGTLVFSIANAIPHHGHHSRVLVEKVTAVAFASPEFRGLYKFQILSSGTVQRVDNKDQIEFLAQLSTSIVHQIEIAVNKIDLNSQLTFDRNLPRCADAPTQTIYIYKGESKVAIKKRQECVDYLSTDASAQTLADWVDRLDSSLAPIGLPENQVNRFFNHHEGDKKIASCTEISATGDENFHLYLSSSEFEENVLKLTIERTLIAGRTTENYLVTDKTKDQPVGGPALYEGSNIKLTIQGTTTPRPDGKLIGHFRRHIGEYQVETKDLLCSYM